MDPEFQEQSVEEGRRKPNFLMEKVKDAFRGFISWIITKFIDDDERWDAISVSITTEICKLANDFIPQVIDHLREAISVGLTGEKLFEDEHLEELEE